MAINEKQTHDQTSYLTVCMPPLSGPLGRTTVRCEQEHHVHPSFWLGAVIQVRSVSQRLLLLRRYHQKAKWTTVSFTTTAQHTSLGLHLFHNP